MTHDPREALQYIADNDIPYLKTSVPVPKGWPGHYGYMAKQALTASAPKGEPCAYADWGQIVQSLLRSMDATIKDESSRDQAVRMADELCSKYPSPPPAPGWDENCPYYDERFEKGVQHVVDMLARNLAVDDYVAGDGSEDYDCDLWQTILNILAAKGLYDKDECEFAALRREAPAALDGGAGA